MKEKSQSGHTTYLTSAAYRSGSFWRRCCSRKGLSTCIGKRLLVGMSNTREGCSFRWSSGFNWLASFWISNIISYFKSLDLFFKYIFRAGSRIIWVISFEVNAAFRFLACFVVVSNFCIVSTGNGTTTMKICHVHNVGIGSIAKDLEYKDGQDSSGMQL